MAKDSKTATDTAADKKATEAGDAGKGEATAAKGAAGPAAKAEKPAKVDKAPEIKIDEGAKPAGETAPKGGEEAKPGAAEAAVVALEAHKATSGPALSAAERARQNPLLSWLSSQAATIAIAAALGALAGSVLSGGIGYAIATGNRTASPDLALQTTVSQLADQVAALKATMATQPSREITGSIAPAAPALPSDAAAWTLWRVQNGRALVEGNGRYYEVAPGSTLPGLGLVQRIMRQDGRWMVQTRNGTILPRS